MKKINYEHCLDYMKEIVDIFELYERNGWYFLSNCDIVFLDIKLAYGKQLWRMLFLFISAVFLYI